MFWDARDVVLCDDYKLEGVLEPAMLSTLVGASYAILGGGNYVMKYDTTFDTDRVLGTVSGVSVDIGVVIIKFADSDLLIEAIQAQSEMQSPPFIIDELQADPNPFDVLVSNHTGYAIVFYIMHYLCMTVAFFGGLLVVRTSLSVRHEDANTLMKMAVVWPVIAGSLLRAWFWREPFGLQGTLPMW